jgi:uncharacterized delta-60 repeat protein
LRLAALAVVLVLAAALPGAAGAAPGDLDPSFGTGGKVMTAFQTGHARGFAIEIQPNGKIITAGDLDNDRFALARYLPDGSLDPIFDGDGRLTTDFGASAVGGAAGIAIQANGRILAVGGRGDFAVARYRRDGGLDATWDDDGKVTTDFGRFEVCEDVLVQPDGHVVVVGTSTQDGPGGDWALPATRPTAASIRPSERVGEC